MQKSLHAADYQHFLDELRAARDAAGLTQQELANRLGEHQTLVSKVERGVRRLDVVELRLWTAALGTTLVEFTQTLDARLSRHALPPSRRRT